MLARLRHNAFVRGHYQHHQIDPVRAGQHVFDKTFVPGHVDEAEMNIPHGQVGEADVNRDAPLLLLFQTVGVDARQRLDEGSLAVINVTSCSDDDSLHDEFIDDTLRYDDETI